MGASATGHIFYGVYFGEDDPRWPEGEYGREEPDGWDDDGTGDWESWLMANTQTDLVDPYDPHLYPDGRPVRDSDTPRMGSTRLGYADREAKYEREVDEWEKANSNWIKYRKNYWDAKSKLVRSCPVALITIGHYDYPRYALIVNGTEFTGDYGAEPIPEGHFALADRRIREAVTWCEDHGLPFENPAWLIGGSYG